MDRYVLSDCSSFPPGPGLYPSHNPKRTISAKVDSARFSPIPINTEETAASGEKGSAVQIQYKKFWDLTQTVGIRGLTG
jgi:hypothetical protein